MATFSEYRRYAEDCLRWAGQAKTEKDKRALLDMAEAWNHIALVQRDVTRQSAFDGIGTTPPVHF
jgi:hypothetical protein